MTRPLFLAPERPADGVLADALIGRAFGPGRYAKSAERLREGNEAIAELSFLAWMDGRAVGCVRLWPITIGGTAALLLGPIAVDESERSGGIGAALVRRACDAAHAAGHGLVLLVGDEAYFGEFGFFAAGASCVRLPGPVDQNRVLINASNPRALAKLAGPVRGAPRAPSPTPAASRPALIAS
ncbi:MAG TPA: N-acetyltransferase [Caulobacteraceae bacterium]|jgi:predicted N-acetyltransferase YhbS